MSGFFALTRPLVALPKWLAHRISWPIVTAYLRNILFLLKQIGGLSFKLTGADKTTMDGPVLMPRLSKRAERMFANIEKAGNAQGADAHRR